MSIARNLSLLAEGASTAGVLGVANGGTNLTTAPLGIASGGTNSTATPTAGTVIYGNGTAYAVSSVGTTGQLLTSQGASAPIWATPTAPAIPTGALLYVATNFGSM